MKILMINDYAFPRGGAEAYVRNVRTLLENAGHQTSELTAPTDTSLARAGARVYSIAAQRTTARALREFAPDIVHVHNCSRALSPAPVVAASRARVPVVMTVHDAHLVCPKTWMLDNRSQPCRDGFGSRCLTSNCRTSHMGPQALPYHVLKFGKVWLHRALLRDRVDTFVAPSRWLQAWLQTSLGARRVVHLPNFSAPAYVPDHRAERSSRLLFVGRLVPEKGVDTLLRSIALLPRHIHADIAGDGPMRGQLQAQCLALNIADRVHFHGELDATRTAELYASALGLVAPSVWMENSPLVVFEALAAGVPVVGARRGGIAELIREGENGVLFEPEDPHDLARAIEALTESPATTQALATAAAAISQNEYSTARHLERLVAVYRGASARCGEPEHVRAVSASPVRRGEA